MAEDSFKRLVELQKRLRRQLEPFSASVKALQADSGVQRLIEDAQRHQALIRAALGPFEELRFGRSVFNSQIPIAKAPPRLSGPRSGAFACAGRDDLWRAA